MTGVLRLRPLTDRDRPALQELLDADPGYALRVTGEPPEPGGAADLLVDRPPDLHPNQKTVLGAFDGDGLAAVIDVLRGWPNPTTAHIGLLQVHPSRKRQGVGRRAHDLLLAYVADWTEVTTLRAAIVGTNAAEAEPFWAALGYQPTGTPKRYQAGTTTTDVSAWTRAAHAPNPASNPAPSPSPNPAQTPRMTR
jgi:GNAT superfamily N-acetyltransferase